ncbi:MAG: hypothetical protein IKW46_07495 [Bacteroidaceae bacterium]|nr:hypothetical protein [Bacteroidaceae bacterium]
MRLNLKYTAIKVDEIEQSKKLPIENCIADTTVGNLALFIQKGLVNDSGSVGVSRAQALTAIDEYLAENDKDELVMDIMEALINGGFLSREVDLTKVRELKAKRQAQLMAELDDQ